MWQKAQGRLICLVFSGSKTFSIPVYIWKGLILGVCLFVGCDCIYTLLSKQKLLESKISGQNYSNVSVHTISQTLHFNYYKQSASNDTVSFLFLADHNLP